MGHSASIKRFKELEEIASPLEPEAVQRSTLNGAAIDYAEDFLVSLADTAAYKQPKDCG